MERCEGLSQTTHIGSKSKQKDQLSLETSTDVQEGLERCKSQVELELCIYIHGFRRLKHRIQR